MKQFKYWHIITQVLDGHNHNNYLQVICDIKKLKHGFTDNQTII